MPRRKSAAAAEVNDPSPAVRLFGARISDKPSGARRETEEVEEISEEGSGSGLGLGEYYCSSREDHDSLCPQGDLSDNPSSLTPPRDNNVKAADQKPDGDEICVAGCSSRSWSQQQKVLEAQLPCPRCTSTNTKFCYFNNYNVNQPRHLCKACHRYWTAGGKVRNVPVGIGIGIGRAHRKNKISCGPQQDQASLACGGGPALPLQVGSSSADQNSSLSPSAASSAKIDPVYESAPTASILLLGPGTSRMDSMDHRASLSSPHDAAFAGVGVSRNVSIKQVGVSSNSNPLPTMQGFAGPSMAFPYKIDQNGLAYGSDGGGGDGQSQSILVAWGSSAFPKFCPPNSSYTYVHPWDAGPSNLQSSCNLVTPGSLTQFAGKHSRDVSSEKEEKHSVPKTPRTKWPRVSG
ncbi:hypothetical protein Dimus_021895 [Dionaea muscipula]